MRRSAACLWIQSARERKMIDGRTGRTMDCEIYIGPVGYMRLKHMVHAKMHSRAAGRAQFCSQPTQGMRWRHTFWRNGATAPDRILGTIQLERQTMRKQRCHGRLLRNHNSDKSVPWTQQTIRTWPTHRKTVLSMRRQGGKRPPQLRRHAHTLRQ